MSTWILREAASGPGLRVAVKDLIDVAGLPTTAGSRAVADRAIPATADAPCLAGLRAAIGRGQACLVGKTNLHELAYGISGINAAFGTPVNPLDPLRVPGGSSSGSAVAVASGEADVAYGSDTGGSIRIPAACCGIAGLKTTWGRIPLDGVWPLAPSMDTVGPMARDVAGLIAGMELLEPGFSVAAGAPRVVGRVVIGADPTIDRAVDAALAAAGWEVVPVGLDGLDQATIAAMTVLDAEAWASDGGYADSAPDKIGHDVLARLRQAATITPAAVSAAREYTLRWRASLSSLWDRVELLALPTLLGFPPTLERSREMPRIRGLTSPVNLAGFPALALPVPAGGPLPASVQLIGPAGGEELLLAAGTVLEQALLDSPGPQGLALPAAAHALDIPARVISARGGGLIAHRIPRMTAWPAGRTTARSVSGRYGRYSGRRAQPGSSEVAAAARTPYGARATIGSGGVSSRKRAAARASAVPRSSARYWPIRSASSASVRGGSGTPSSTAIRATSATYPSRPAWSRGSAPNRVCARRKLSASAMWTQVSRCGSEAA
jgi:amidase